jgi:arylsulfatase A-like enzyme
MRPQVPVPQARRASLSSREPLPDKSASTGTFSKLWNLVALAIWLGIFTGLVEGCLLIIFQRLNWRDWGRMLHVSAPVIWISPLIDLLLFGMVACVVAAVARVFPKIPSFATTVFCLAFLTMYDWLTCIGRLRHWSCFLLAVGLASVFTRWAARNEIRVLRFWRRTVPALVCVLLVAFAAIHWRSEWRERRELSRLPSPAAGAPNVLVVVFDTLRADHVSAYGYARETSPNIDRLAREGVLFENAIAPAPWSLPSHVSLLTGKYQFEHGMGDVPEMSVTGLRPQAMNGSETLAETLEQHGYRTGAFSANRTYFSANLGFYKGFSHFEDYYDSAADCFVRTLYGREFARVYLTRSDRSGPRRLIRWLGWESLLDKDDEGAAPGGTQGVRKRAPEVNREMLRWIDSSPHNRPFFAFLNYFDVHHRYGGPVSFHGPWGGGEKQVARPADHSQENDPASLGMTEDKNEREQVINQYDDGIKYDDNALGDLLRDMEKRGLLENTVVVITSDHGESLGEHHIAYHGESLYREQVWVPMVFWCPGRVPAGSRVLAVVSNASIPATVMSVLKLNPVEDFRRPLLAALWTSLTSNASVGAISEVAQIYPTAAEDLISEKFVPTAMQGAMKSLTTDRWQLITHERLGNQLYDYTADPHELKDVFRAADSQEIVGKLMFELRSKMMTDNRNHAGH